VPAQITAAIRRGVVCLPHGYGHDREGARLDLAAQHSGASMNDLTDPAELDLPSGNAVLSGVPVEITAVLPATHGAGPEYADSEVSSYAPTAGPVGQSGRGRGAVAADRHQAAEGLDRR
jgi:hypothetical protein